MSLREGKWHNQGYTLIQNIFTMYSLFSHSQSIAEEKQITILLNAGLENFQY